MSQPLYPSLETVQRVLVIKLRHLGDVLLTSPVFSSLRRALPQALIDAYIYSDCEPMLAGHPAIDSLLLCDQSRKKNPLLQRFAHEVTLLRRIRKNGYDLVINLTEGDRGAIAALASKARYCVGWDPGKKRKRRLYTHIVKRPHGDRHVVELNLDAVRRIGIHPTVEERRLLFTVPQSASESAEDKLKALGAPTEGFVLFHPAARWLFKCLPPASVARLLAWLHAKGYEVVLTASLAEKELAMVQEIERLAPRGSFFNMAGRLNLKELGAVIAKSALFIGMDSAPMHMAAALDKPLIAIFGPTSEKAWGPWTPLNEGRAKTLFMPLSCRPCGLDGCGGSKVSDCLQRLPVEWITCEIERMHHAVYSTVGI